MHLDQQNLLVESCAYLPKSKDFKKPVLEELDFFLYKNRTHFTICFVILVNQELLSC